jgi:hypothetical protein
MEFPQLGLPWLWGCITSRANLQLQWGPKKIYSPSQMLFNGMSHATCTQWNRVNSWLLVVRSQIVNLILNLSFGHNLCFKCANESCKPILDIYASIFFQWYKFFFKAMGFDPYNCTLKIQKSIWNSNSYNGSSLGSVRVHSLTLFALPGACDVTPRSLFGPATLQPLALVTNPRLGFRHQVSEHC